MNDNAIRLDYRQIESTISTFTLAEKEISIIQQKLNDSVTQLDEAWIGRGKKAFEKEWEDYNSNFQSSLKKLQELRANLEHTKSFMQEADATAASTFFGEVATIIYNNKEILAALITLSVPIVQSMLERYKQRHSFPAQEITIKILVEGNVIEVKENETSNNQKLLEKLISANPGLLEKITPDSTLKISPIEDTNQEPEIEVRLDKSNQTKRYLQR